MEASSGGGFTDWRSWLAESAGFGPSPTRATAPPTARDSNGALFPVQAATFYGLLASGLSSSRLPFDMHRSHLPFLDLVFCVDASVMLAYLCHFFEAHQPSLCYSPECMVNFRGKKRPAHLYISLSHRKKLKAIFDMAFDKLSALNYLLQRLDLSANYTQVQELGSV